MLYRTIRVSNRNQLKDFIKLPYIIYSGDDNWIPPLESEVRRVLNRKNPYFKKAELHLFNCYKDNNIAGRIALIMNKGYDIKFNKCTALFGFFECINDRDAANELMNTVFNYCRNKEVKLILGPFNPNHYSELGLQVSSFDTEASFFQTYNPQYYCDLLSNCGFNVVKKIHTRKRDGIKNYLKERYGNREISVPEGYSLRPFNPHKKKQELELLRDIYNDAFSENSYFLPVSSEEYIFSAKYLSIVTDPELLLFTEYYGEPVGVIHFALDINPLLKKLNGKQGPLKLLRFFRERKKIEKVIFYAIGIKKAHRNTKTILTQLIGCLQILKKFKTLETTWMTYDNLPALRVSEKLGLEPDKEFVILEKELP